MENEEKERKRKEDKEKRERNRKEKEKRQNILTARVDNLVARMNDNMDDRFGSELISQCCEILSSNCSRESEDEADHLLMQHPEGRKDSGTPLSVTQRPSSSQPEPAHQFPSLSSTGHRQLPSLDRNVEADLAELIQHQDARKAPSTPFVSGRSQKSPSQSTMQSQTSMQKQFGGKQFTSILGQPRATPLRPTTGMKRPRQYPLQQRISDTEDDEDLESEYCSNCKKLKKENEELKRNLEEISQDKGMQS